MDDGMASAALQRCLLPGLPAPKPSVLAAAAGECDEDIAACYCPSNTTYGRIPAPIEAPQGGPEGAGPLGAGGCSVAPCLLCHVVSCRGSARGAAAAVAVAVAVPSQAVGALPPLLPPVVAAAPASPPLLQAARRCGTAGSWAPTASPTSPGGARSTLSCCLDQRGGARLRGPSTRVIVTWTVSAGRRFEQRRQVACAWHGGRGARWSTKCRAGVLVPRVLRCRTGAAFQPPPHPPTPLTSHRFSAAPTPLPLLASRLQRRDLRGPVRAGERWHGMPQGGRACHNVVMRRGSLPAEPWLLPQGRAPSALLVCPPCMPVQPGSCGRPAWPALAPRVRTPPSPARCPPFAAVLLQSVQRPR